MVLNRLANRNCAIILGVLARGCFFDGEGQPVQMPTGTDSFDSTDAIEDQRSKAEALGDVGAFDASDYLALLSDELSNPGPDALLASEATYALPDTAPADAALPPACTPSCDDGSGCTIDTCEVSKGCQHLDKYFSSLYAQPIGFAAAVVAVPNGFVTLTNDETTQYWYGPPRLTKFDSSATLLWTVPFANAKLNPVGQSLIAMADGFGIAGGVIEGPGGPEDALIARTDLSGKVLWSKTLGSNNHHENATALVALPNGLAFVGENGNFNVCVPQDYGDFGVAWR